MHNIYIIIQGYLNGEISESEKEKLWKWVKEDETHEQELRNLMKLHTLSVWRDNANVREGKTTLTIKKFYKVAALLILFIGISTLINYVSNHKENNFITQGGEIATFYLPDSSKVTLNSVSKISWLGNFKNNRVVRLDGEAIFDVRKNKNLPFIVETSEYEVVVKGTEFLVSDYKDESLTFVELIQGKVGITRLHPSLSGDTCFLNPNQQFTLNRVTKERTVQKIDTSINSGWRDNKYYFQDVTFEEMSKRIEKYFDVSIEIKDDSIKKQKVFVSFSKSQSVKSILEGVNFEQSYQILQPTNKKFIICTNE